jgi:hypothetical protein
MAIRPRAIPPRGDVRCHSGGLGQERPAPRCQVRMDTAGRATYSELHEALREGTACRGLRPGILLAKRGRAGSVPHHWRRSTVPAPGTRTLLAATRLGRAARTRGLARQRPRPPSPSSRRGPFPFGAESRPQRGSSGAFDPGHSPRAPRAIAGDAASGRHPSQRIPTKRYDHGSRGVSAGSVPLCRRFDTRVDFLAGPIAKMFRVRYLTLLSYCTDPGVDSHVAGTGVMPTG